MSDNSTQIVNRILAMSLLQQAQIEMLLDLIEQVGAKSGYTEVSGIAIREWFQNRKHEVVERMLIDEEDKDPSIAAFLQQVIDESMKRINKSE